jgi:hypothetical protein
MTARTLTSLVELQPGDVKNFFVLGETRVKDDGKAEVIEVEVKSLASSIGTVQSGRIVAREAGKEVASVQISQF